MCNFLLIFHPFIFFIFCRAQTFGISEKFNFGSLAVLARELLLYFNDKTLKQNQKMF